MVVSEGAKYNEQNKPIKRVKVTRGIQASEGEYVLIDP